MNKKQKLNNKYFYFIEFIIILVMTISFEFLYSYSVINNNNQFIPYIKINEENIILSETHNCNLSTFCYSIPVKENDIITFESDYLFTGSGIYNSVKILDSKNNFAYSVSYMDKNFYFTSDEYTFKFYDSSLS